jgi:transposase
MRKQTRATYQMPKVRDYETAKKVKGRKRHLLVDTLGLMIEARLHTAQIQEREGIKLLLDSAARDRLTKRLSPMARRRIHRRTERRAGCRRIPDWGEKLKPPRQLHWQRRF